MTTMTSFFNDQRGATAITFGLLLLPLMAAVGSAVDYSRAANVRTSMQAAADAAALFAARDVRTAGTAQLTDRVQQVFRANFHRPGARIESIAVSKNARSIQVTAHASLQTVFMGVFKINTMELTATSEVAWGQNRIELALVLDNTGSMATSNKMQELKKAVRDLLSTLEDASSERNAIRISIVPFDTQVNVGDDNRNASWLDFDANVGRDLRVDQRDWRGCVADRAMPFDTNDAAPSAANTRYPAVRCGTGSLAQIRPLTSNFSDLRRTVDDMRPSGNTNITIGVAWGLASLSPSAPLDQGTAFGTARVKKIMIVLTDGDNTQNRYTDNASDIDDRTRKACDEAKTRGVAIHAIRVIEGNARLLRGCASSPSMYHEVRNAGDLGPVFRRIADEIAGIRLSS